MTRHPHETDLTIIAEACAGLARVIQSRRRMQNLLARHSAELAKCPAGTLDQVIERQQIEYAELTTAIQTMADTAERQLQHAPPAVAREIRALFEESRASAAA